MDSKALVVRDKPGKNEVAFDAGPQALAEQAERTGADYLLFERNEQSGWPIAAVNRATKKGYCSFSGIDADVGRTQNEACWHDWKKGRTRLGFRPKPVLEQKAGSRTFSLILDTEQLGGVRFGLPRILDLLWRKNVRATFFLTNVVAEVYGDLVPLLRDSRHEVGVHGWCHEYLQGVAAQEQAARLGAMTAGLGGSVTGANFIGRMNGQTLSALRQSGFSYFVFPLKNNRRVLAAYTDPVWVEPGLWAVPVFAETYGKTWPKIKKQIDVTLGRMPQKGHLTLLGHPFFDGSKIRMPVLETTLQYLKQQGLTGVPVREALGQPPKTGGGRLTLRSFGASGARGIAERIQNSLFCLRYGAAKTKPRVACK